MQVVFVGKLIDITEKEDGVLCTFEIDEKDKNSKKIECYIDKKYELILIRYGFLNKLCVKCSFDFENNKLYIKDLLF